MFRHSGASVYPRLPLSRISAHGGIVGRQWKPPVVLRWHRGRQGVPKIEKSATQHLMWKPDLPQKFLITRTKAIRDGPWGSSWVENHWTPVQKCGTVMTTHSNSYNLLVLFNYSKRGWTCLWHPKFFLKCRELPSSSQPWHQPQVLRLMDIILEGVDLPYMAKNK